MNNYRNFLNESIYDINILKELKLGDSLNEEIFTEARVASTVTTKDGIKIYVHDLSIEITGGYAISHSIDRSIKNQC